MFVRHLPAARLPACRQNRSLAALRGRARISQRAGNSVCRRPEQRKLLRGFHRVQVIFPLGRGRSKWTPGPAHLGRSVNPAVESQNRHPKMPAALHVSLIDLLVPGGGVEPPWPRGPADFPTLFARISLAPTGQSGEAFPWIFGGKTPDGGGYRNRTDMRLLSGVFETPASASSANPPTSRLYRSGSETPR